MKLVKLDSQDGDVSFINPEQVIAIESDGLSTVIIAGQGSKRVRMHYAKVYELLTGEQYEGSDT